MISNEYKPSVTLEVRTNKSDNQEVRLRFRVRCGRDFQWYFKSSIKGSVHNLMLIRDRRAFDGTEKQRNEFRQLEDAVNGEIERLKNAAIVAVGRGTKSSDEFSLLMNDKAVTGETTTLLDDFQAYINERTTTTEKKLRIADNSAKMFDATFKHLKTYLEGAGLETVTTKGFTADMLIDWLKYMGGRVSQNSRCTYSSVLRRFLADAESKDLIPFSPYRKRQDEIKTLTAREKPDEPFALTLDELKTIAATDVPQRLQHTKEIFLMQCYIGCRLRDLSHVTMQDIKVCEYGFRYITYVPEKTKKERFKVTTPLVPSAVKLLDSGVTLPMSIPATNGHNDKVRALLHHCGVTRNVETWDKRAQRYIDSPLWCVASSKICRRTAESLLTAYQVNMFTTGLHAVGSDAIKSYVDMTLTQRYRLMCAAYGETPENV